MSLKIMNPVLNKSGSYNNYSGHLGKDHDKTQETQETHKKSFFMAKYWMKRKGK